MEGHVYRISLKFGTFNRLFYSHQPIDDFRRMVEKNRSRDLKEKKPTYVYDEILRAIDSGDYELISEEEMKEDRKSKPAK